MKQTQTPDSEADLPPHIHTILITDHSSKKIANPLLTICCTTYNHEKFIAEAIEGFLLQKTTFPVELIIHDDASTDKTAEIIRKYESQHPKLISAIYQSENQYSKGIRPFREYVQPITRGKYIALCEGDDYWTDPTKLQKQVDFLENNTDFSICYHDVSILQNGELTKSHVPIYDKERLTIADLALENCIHTPSCVYRNNLFTQYPEALDSCPVGDYILHLLNAEHGDIKHLSDNMAVYRRHEGGVWAGRGLANKLSAWLDVLSPLMLYFNENQQVKKNLRQQHLDTLLRLIKTAGENADKVALKEALVKAATWENEHIAQYIIDMNHEIIKTQGAASDINEIINNISLHSSFIVFIKKLYYKTLKPYRN